MTRRLAAEFVGAFALVLIGCGTFVLGGGLEGVGQLGIALAFGLALTALIYALGAISGCHVNPAVSFAMWIARRMTRNEFVGYAIAQILGGIVGAGALYLIATGAASWDINTDGLGQNGYGVHSPGQYALLSCLLFEVIATFLFVLVFLGATQPSQPTQFAGLAIGAALAAVHVVGIQVTGVSVNPARSIGPALIAGGGAVGELWLFILAPLIGAGLAGLAFRAKFLSADVI